MCVWPPSPDTVLTDNEAVFTGKVFKGVSEILGCGLMTTIPYNPQGNGVVERLHGTLKPMLIKAKREGVDWSRFLPLALFALKVPNADTGLSPFQVVYGFDVRGPLDQVYAGWVEETCEGMDVSA